MTPIPKWLSLLLFLVGGFIGNGAPFSPGQLDPDYRPRFEKAGGYFVLHPSFTGGYIVELGPEVVGLNGYEVRLLAQVNANGVIVPTFVSPAFLTNASISQVQAHGKIWVAYGPPTPIYPQTPVRFLRLNPDGTRDESFHLPVQTEADEWRLMAVQPDGKILAAVKRPATLIVDQYKLLRLQPDGSIDPTFTSDIDGARILAVSVLADDRMLVEFTPTAFHEYGVSEWTRLMPDGSFDKSYNPAPANFATGSFSAVSPDGEVLIAIYGTDQSLLGGGSGTVHPFVRLRADGSLDPDFHPAVSPGQFVSFLPEGHMLVKTTAATTGITSVAELNHDGSLATSVPLSGTANLGQYLTITVLPTLDYLVQNGGAPRIYSPQGKLLRTLDFALRQAVKPPVPAAFADGALLFGHGGSENPYFETMGANIVTGPALLTASGSLDLIFTLLTRGQSQWTPLQATGGTVLFFDPITQRLISVGRDSSLRVLSGHWSTFSPGEGEELQFQSDGSLIQRTDEMAYGIRPDGHTQFGQQGSGRFGGIHGFNVLPDDKVLLWGFSTTLAGLPENAIGRLRPDLIRADPGFHSSLPVVSQVLLAEPQPDGKVILFCDFHTNNTTHVYQFRRLNEDGSRDTEFNTRLSCDGLVNVIRLDSQGRIMVAGSFKTLAGQPHGGVARLLPDGTPDASFNSGDGPDAPIEKVFVLPGDDLVVYGGFTRFNGEECWGLAKLKGGPPLSLTPQITSLTVPSSVPAGDSVNLGALITGKSPRSFQWFHDGTALPGETNAILTLRQVSSEDEGTYALFVANDTGVDALSTSVTLLPAVADSPRLTFLGRPSDTSISVGLTGGLTNLYRVQISTNLTDWIYAMPVIPANRVSLFGDPYGTKPGPRFARAVQQ